MTVQRILLGMALLGGAAPFVGKSQAQGLDAPAQPFPPGPRPLSAGTGLTNTPPPLMGVGTAQPLATLTAAPSATMNAPGGAAGCGPGGANCCGPVGGNGPVTYELFTRTGPSLIVGGSPDLSGAARFGWMVEGGGRSLFFNTTNDAAWTAEVSLMYAYNGANDRGLDVFARQPRFQAPDPRAGQLTGPDQIQPFNLRGITRAGVNFGLGRDWFLNGPGVLGFEQAWNSRVGVDVSGNYGTIRVDLLPLANLDSYFRRYSTTTGIMFGAHYDAEMPMGGWILFGGLRAQYGFHHSNVVPPLSGNFQDLNLLVTLGVRF